MRLKCTFIHIVRIIILATDEPLKDAIESVKNLSTDTIKDAVKQRMANPFFASFIFSWLAFNWERVLILLFDGRTIVERIAYIRSINSAYVYDNFVIEHAETLFFPLITSVLFVLFSPIMTLLLTSLHRPIYSFLYSLDVKSRVSKLEADSLLIAAQVENQFQKPIYEERHHADLEEEKARRALASSNLETMKQEIETYSLSIEAKKNEIASLDAQVDSLMKDLIKFQEHEEALKQSSADKTKHSNEVLKEGMEAYQSSKYMHNGNRGEIFK